MKKFCLTMVIILSTVVGGCGYTTSSALPGHLKTIHVEKFDNQISYTSNVGRRNLYFPLLEVDVHNAVIDRYLFDGNLRIADKDLADLILKGTLKSYRRDALRVDDNDDVEEYRVYVTVSLELWDMKYNELMWSVSSLSGEATYFLTGPEASSEESAVSEAITDLARRIVERTIENW